MIKKQYDRYADSGYFHNFVMQLSPTGYVKEALVPYKATIGKSKNPRATINVKWHDEKLYSLFVMRWS